MPKNSFLGEIFYQKEFEMLVLLRQKDETFTITVPPGVSTSEITVMVVSVGTKNVKIGIVAPPSVKVTRHDYRGEK